MNRTWPRLITACLLSLLVHFVVIWQVPVQPTPGSAGAISLINARLEPEKTTTEANNAPQSAPSATPSDLTDTLAKPAAVKPTAQPVANPAPVAPSASATVGIKLPVVRDPTYYPARQLDVYPQALAPIVPPYPKDAEAQNIRGRVVLLLLIDDFGFVTDASVVEADPPGYFEEAALDVFNAARFSPGNKDGRAVKSRVLIQVRFSPENAPLYGGNETPHVE